MPSTRCIEVFRLSVPESAWLISRSVDKRRASRVAVGGSAPGFAAAIRVSYISEGAIVKATTVWVTPARAAPRLGKLGRLRGAGCPRCRFSTDFFVVTPCSYDKFV